VLESMGCAAVRKAPLDVVRAVLTSAVQVSAAP
jgi:hypothetical protein